MNIEVERISVRLIILGLVAMLSVFCICCNKLLDHDSHDSFFNTPDHPTTLLQFDQHHHFRILQLTDIHYDASQYTSSRRDQIKTLILLSDPDLIILTGDIVCGQPVPDLWWQFISFLSQLNRPYILTLGNHDSQHLLNRSSLYRLIQSFPNCLNRQYSQSDAQTKGDFVVEIKGSRDYPGALLFAFDSNEVSFSHPYLGIYPRQTQWYKLKAKKYTDAYPTDSIPALAFMHIPLPEMETLYQMGKSKTIGSHLEKSYVGTNNGFLDILHETNLVNGVFFGHDHNNDYLINNDGIALAYGRSCTTGNIYGTLSPGGRIIELEEGVKSFKTYILQCDGKKLSPLTFPDDMDNNVGTR